MASERLKDRGIADYVRLEFRPADQAAMWYALRRAGTADRPRRTPGFVRRLRTWLQPTKAPRDSASIPQ